MNKNTILMLCIALAQACISNASQSSHSSQWNLEEELAKIRALEATMKTGNTCQKQISLNALRSQIIGAIYWKATQQTLDHTAFQAFKKSTEESEKFSKEFPQVLSKEAPFPQERKRQLEAFSTLNKNCYMLALAFKKSNDALIAQEQAQKTTSNGYCTNLHCWQINPCRTCNK